MNEELLKTLNGAIDVAIKELMEIDTLSKGDMNLQDAKLRPESANGSLPGDNREESTLKPEDAHKAESADKGDLHIMHEDDDDEDEEDKAKKADDCGDDYKKADKAKKAEDDKSKGKKDKEDKEHDEEDEEDDMDDDKAEKLKARLKKYEAHKAAKAKKMASPLSVAGAMMSKSEMDEITDTLKKSVSSKVEELHKSFGDRLSTLEGLLQKLIAAPQPRQSVSGLSPLAKSGDDVQSGESAPLQKGEVLNKLWQLQKSDDKRVDSTVIARVEMGDYSVLAERGINLK